MRIRDLVRSDDPGAQRAERVDRLAEREHPGLHLAPLDVPRRDVVEDHVAADVVHRLLRPEPLTRLADHERQLELVVELIRQVLGIDDRLVGPNDRVHILEEDDPGRDPVRPPHLLRLLLVLAEVAGRVEELLRHDRGAQADVLERELVARRARNLVALEVMAHRRHLELHDLVSAQLANLAVVEGDQAGHAGSQSRIAARA